MADPETGLVAWRGPDGYIYQTVELASYIIEALLNTIRAIINAIKAIIYLVKTFIDSVKALVHILFERSEQS